MMDSRTLVSLLRVSHLIFDVNGCTQPLRHGNSVTGTIGVIEMGTQDWKRVVVQDL